MRESTDFVLCDVSPTAKRRMARMSSGSKSKQDYETPWEFFRAAERRYGKIICDLAAHEKNHKCDHWIGEKENTLSVDWHKIGDGVLWLNPPFVDIYPFAQKCWEESQKGAKILLLTPASVETEWWRDFVHYKGWAEWTAPRLQFIGATDPYPKPLSLTAFGPWGSGYGRWRWDTCTNCH